MKNRINRRSYPQYFICLLLIAVVCGQAGAQTFPEPEREQLLNGLKVLLWQRPGDANVLLRLRIHSGAAFDLAAKGGTMALLADALFPDPATPEYVTEQLGGKLEVTTSYDGIDITIAGKEGDFERLVDLLRGALVTNQLTPENVARVREARIKQLSDKRRSGSEVADQAIAARMFGSFPYGHPPGGTVESVSKIARADLMLARERFLNADNATLVVISGVGKLRVMRTLRQLIGPWQKADRTVPATFRQPAAPDARVLLLNQADATSAQVRLAVRGLARSDRDAAAASVLAQIVRARWQAALPDLSSTFTRHEAQALPGVFVLGASAPTASASKAITAAQQVLQALAQTGPTAVELDGARGEALADINRQASQPEPLAGIWLDVEGFKLAAANTQASSIGSLTVADIQRVAGRLFKDASMATVVVGNAEQLKTSLGSSVEVQNDKPAMKTAAEPAIPTKKP
jgi:zinc protease